MEFAFDEAYLRMIRGATQVDFEASGTVADPVDRLLRLLDKGPLSPSAVQAGLGLKHRPTFRANYLHPALQAGLIEMTVPDKPNSRLQKYRLTAPGQAKLQSLARKT